MCLCVCVCICTCARVCVCVCMCVCVLIQENKKREDCGKAITMAIYNTDVNLDIHYMYTYKLFDVQNFP